MKLIMFAAFLSPISLIAFSTGPPVRRTGNLADGGQNCTACHRTFAPADSDPRGSVKIVTTPYTPGVMQQIQISIAHPLQQRWGFELTSRLASDPSKQTGTFAVGGLIRVRCDAGHDAPCDPGDLQFAEHNSAQFTAVGAGFTYTVNWTPPANSVGDIVFYAAGNAANGDGTLNGDRIYTTSTVISPATCNLSTLPTLSSAVNAASFQSPVSPNSLVALFGGALQPTGLTRGLYPSDIASNTLPSILSCMAVEFNGVRAPLFYAQSNQVNVVVPSATVTGPANVRVVLNPDSPAAIFSPTIPVTTAAVSPGIFTLDGVQAAAQFSNSTTLVNTSKPAKPGDLVTLYATGLGDTTPHYDAAAIVQAAAPTLATVTVLLNGTAVPASNVTYSGLTPGGVNGLYQVNLQIPPGVSTGNATVALGVNGVQSQAATTLALVAQ